MRFNSSLHPSTAVFCLTGGSDGGFTPPLFLRFLCFLWFLCFPAPTLTRRLHVITCSSSVNVYGNGLWEQAKCFPSAALCSNNTAALMSHPPEWRGEADGLLLSPSPRMKQGPEKGKKHVIHLKCAAAGSGSDVLRAASIKGTLCNIRRRMVELQPRREQEPTGSQDFTSMTTIAIIPQKSLSSIKKKDVGLI